MPTTKKTSKSTKAAKKSYAGKGSKIAVPPPDNPLRRHEETSLDLNVVVDAQSTTAASVSYIAATSKAVSKRGPKKTPTTSAEGVYEAGERDVSQMCKLRLAALEQSRGMPHIDRGAPMLMAAAIAGAPQPVAPVAGVSNWVQLGPTAIPKGQTYGGPRVLVTGRVTGIVVDPTAPNTIYCATAQGGVWKRLTAEVAGWHLRQ